MDWATRRQRIVIAIFVLLGIAFAAVVGIAIFYKTPTCTDQKQNQGETGIDCGGPCTRACTATEKAAQVRFARAITAAVDRTDVIAYVDNPNDDAYASNVPATVEVYDANHTLLASRDVSFNLPVGGVAPVFVQGILSSSIPVTQTFFTIHDSAVVWTRTNKKPTIPGVQNIQWQTAGVPRVTATLTNPTAQSIDNIVLIATVFDASGQAIAASRTVVAHLPAQGTAPATFTWNTPFESAPARVDVTPIGVARGL